MHSEKSSLYLIDKERLQKFMEIKGISSLTSLAEKAGIHRNTLNAHLSGKQGIFSSAIVSIAKTLGRSPLELISERKDTPIPFIIQEKLTSLEKICSEFSGLAILLIGSHAKKKATKNSDIDLGLCFGHKENVSSQYLKCKSILQDLFEDSPKMIDIVNLNDAPGWFIEEMSYKPIFICGDQQSYNYFLGVCDGYKRERKN